MLQLPGQQLQPCSCKLPSKQAHVLLPPAPPKRAIHQNYSSNILHALPSSVEGESEPSTSGKAQVARTSRSSKDVSKVVNNVVPSPHKAQGKQQQQQQHRSSRSQSQSQRQQYLLEPVSTLDIDQDLWQVLDLCSDDELETVYNLLYAPSPFSPVVKSLVAENEPALLGLRGRLSVMHKIEARFRFLAADSNSLLHGRRPSYRDTLLSIRHRMDIPCSANLATFDLETEVFLHILKNCVEYVQGEADLTDPQQAASAAYANEGDGMSSSSHKSQKGGHWAERVTAPFRFGLKELAPTLAKLGSAVTLTAVGKSTAQQLAAQLVSSHLKYQAALRATSAVASRGGGGLLAGWGKRAVLDAAQKGLTTATARYSAIQGALSFLGPVMWGWLAFDLAYKSIGTDYARVIRAVFILAQVRLVSTGGFIQPPHEQQGSPAAGTSSATQQQQQQRQSYQHSSSRRASPSAASSQEVVVEGGAQEKGVVRAVVPYAAAAAAAAYGTAGAGMAQGEGSEQGSSCSSSSSTGAVAHTDEGEGAAEEARAAAAVERHPHRFRHLLDCSEELCDDDEVDPSERGCRFDGDEDEVDPFSDSVC